LGADVTNPAAPDERDGLLATVELLPRARAGDRQAQQELLERFTPVLTRLLHARLSGDVRGLLETEDLVQEVFSRTLGSLQSFEYRGPGSFWSYLRRVGLNYVTEVYRRQAPGKSPRSVSGTALDKPDSDSGPLGALLREERFSAFESALESLSDVQRQAFLMRMELQLPFEAIASECDFPSPDAARMAVKRAIERLHERLSHDRRLEE
jgi:RNA polymerase sigma factor (sigma-70 family)